MTITSLYIRLREGSRSYNKLNRTLIDLESRLTIDEFTAIRDFMVRNPLKDERRIAEKDWMDNFNRHKVAIKKPASFRRVWGRVSANYYQRDLATPEKVLLIGFAGRQARMMMPTWAFLAALPENISDVLILRTKWNYEDPESSYPNKIELLNSTILEILPTQNFDRTITLGVSAGALPAVLLGFKFKAERIATVSMLSRNDSHYPEYLQLHPDQFAEISERMRMAVTYRDPKAVKTAKELKAQYPKIKIIRYIDPDHAILAYLLRRGRLKAAFRKLLV